MKTKSKIWRPRAAGLDPKMKAPFWSGRRAQHIIAERVAAMKEERERKKRIAAKKRAAKKRKKNASR